MLQETNTSQFNAAHALKNEIIQELGKPINERKAGMEFINCGLAMRLSRAELENIVEYLKERGYKLDLRSVDAKLRDAEIIDELGFLPKTYEDTIKALAEKFGFKATLMGLKRDVEGLTAELMASGAGILHPTEVKFGEALSDIMLWCGNRRFMNHDRYLNMAFDKWFEQQRRERLFEISCSVEHRREFKYVPGINHEWDKFADIITEDKSRVHLTVAVMQGFIWHVKRRIRGLEVNNHCLPILGGKTGNGKSETAKKLIRVLGEDAWATGTFTELEDSNNVDKFSRIPVVFMDEMEKANKADQNAIKKFITADYISFRVFFAQRNDKSKIMSSFIGTTNEHIQDVIPDTTSSRRFYYIGTPRDMEKDWQKLNSIDYELLWQSVNEYGPNPINAHLKEIGDIQHNEQRKKSNIEFWLDEVMEGPVRTMSSSDWFKEYAHWENEYVRNTQTGLQTFSTRLKALAAAKGVAQKNTGKARTYTFGSGVTASHKVVALMSSLNR